MKNENFDIKIIQKNVFHPCMYILLKITGEEKIEKNSILNYWITGTEKSIITTAIACLAGALNLGCKITPSQTMRAITKTIPIPTPTNATSRLHRFSEFMDVGRGCVGMRPEMVVCTITVNPAGLLLYAHDPPEILRFLPGVPKHLVPGRRCTC